MEKILLSLKRYLLLIIISFIFAGSYTAHADITTGLVGYWNLNEGTGTSAADSSGNNLTGTLTNGPVWDSGRIGAGSVGFGVDHNDRIAVSDTAVLQNLGSTTNGFSVGMWVKPTEYVVSASYLLAKLNVSSLGWSFAVSPGAQDGFQFTVDYGTTDLAARSVDSSVQYGAWQHVVMTWDGTSSASGVRIYINGVETGSYDVRVDGVGSRVSDVGWNLTMGNNTGGTRALEGNMDEVRIYSRVLSPSDVTELYNFSAADIVAPVISNISSSTSATTATVGWTTDELSTSKVVLGTAADTYTLSSTSAATVTVHSLGLTGLSPATQYFFRVVSADAASNTSTSSEYTFLTAAAGDSTAPNATVTAPTNGSTVSGTSVSVTASATDNIAVAGVQFKLDGVNLGAEDTTSTYGITWDSTTAADGSHALTAVARDASGNLTTSPTVTVTVDNTAPVRSLGSPSSVLPVDTSTTTLSLTTNENASCSFATSSGVSYASMTPFSNTGTTTHANALSGLVNGTSYVYYVKCQDGVSNTNSTDYTISFSVSSGGGIIGHWALDNGSGTTASDSSVNGNNGTLLNSPTWVAGKIGSNALQFNTDGNDSVSVGSQSLFQDLGPMSISMWVNPVERANEEYLLSKINSTTLGWKLSISPVANDGFNFSVDYDNTDLSVRSRDGSVQYGTWQHVVVTWDGSTSASNVHIYIDGVENGSTTLPYDVQSSAIGSRISDVGRSLIIGNSISGSRPYEGLMDDVRLYNSILTPSEIAALYGLGADNVAPTISAVASTTASTTATITWTTDEPANSQVDYGLTTSYSASSTLDTTATTTHSVVLTGLNSDTTYHFRVRSTDNASNLQVSTDYTFRTTGDTTPPLISSISSSTAPTSITVLWTTNEPTVSLIDYGTTTAYGNASSTAVATTSHSITLTGLTSSTAYNFRISSTDLSNNISTSTNLVATTTATDVTGPVISNVASSTTGTTATITWTTNELSDSQINFGSTTNYTATSSLSSTATTSHRITITGLTAGTTYHFRARSVDTWGNLGTSTDFTFKTASGPTLCGVAGCVSLEDGMMWVMLGDSITNAHYYSDYLQAYFHLRYPNLQLHFRGEGRGGATVTEATTGGRYDKRVYSWDPDIVSVMFGHNGSASQSEFHDQNIDLIDNYIISKNQALPILFGPHPTYTSTGKPALSDYTDQLISIGNDRGYLYANLWDPLFNRWSQNLSSTTPVDLQFDGDTVHPGPSGHLDIAYEILNQLGADQVVSAATINAANKAVSGETYAHVSSVATTSVGVDFTRLDDRLPMAFDDNARALLPLNPSVLDMNQYMLTVTNLVPGTYEVYVDGVLSATTTSGQLASGWNMTAMTQGPIHDQLLEVLGRIRDKEGVVRVPDAGLYGLSSDGPPWKGVVDYRSSSDNGYNNLGYRDDVLKTYLQPEIAATLALDTPIYNAAQPVSRNFSLRLVAGGGSEDLTAPSVSVSAPSNGATVSGSAVTVSASASDNIGVASVQFKVDTNTSIDPGFIFSAPYTTTWDTTQIADGVHTLIAIAADASGNIATSSSISITVDNTAPVRSNGLPATVLPLGTATTTLSLNTNELATCKYSATGGTAYSSMTSFSTTTSTSTHTSIISGISNGGNYVYYVKCQDARGNTNTSDFTISFTVSSDTVSPVVNMTAPTNSSVVSGASVSLTANATDNVSVTGVQFVLDEITNIGVEDTGSPYGVTWNTTGVADGVHVLTAIARDTSDNYTTSPIITITVDNTAPVRSNTAPSGTLGLGTVSTGLFVDTNENATCKYSTAPGTAYGSMTSFTTTGNLTHFSTITGLSNGTSYVYYVKCQDARGNTNNTDTAITFSVAADETTPTISITTPTNLSTSTGSSVTITASASDDVGIVGVKFFLNGVQIGTEDTVSPYTIAWNSTTVVDGAQILNAVARDGAGNYATSSNINVIVENNSPTISTISANPSASGAVISWTTDESATSQVEYGLTTTYSASTTLNLTKVTSHSEVVSGLASATTYQYRVISTDTSGNTTISANNTFVTPSASSNSASSGGGGSSGGANAVSVTTTSTTTNPANVNPLCPIGFKCTTSTSTASQNKSNVKPVPVFTKNLVLNNVSVDTKKLQEFLNKNGFPVALVGAGSKGKETAFFGAATKNALIQFQQKHKLPADGTLNTATRDYINNLEPVVSTSRFPRVVQSQSVGADVRELQRFLNNQGFLVARTGTGSKGKETSVFGPATKSALIRFQRYYKVPATGILDARTLEVMKTKFNVQ